jgi:hypothetical protein
MPDRHVFIDPYLFQIPEFESSDHLRRYLDLLVRWGSAVSEDPDAYSTSEEAVIRLMEEGKYPDYTLIDKLIERFSIEEFTAYDVSNRLNVLAGRRPYIEERCGVTTVLVDTTDGVSPAELIKRLSPGVGKILHDCLFLVASSLSTGWDADPLFFGTYDVDINLSQTIIIEGSLVDAEFSSIDLFDLPFPIHHAIEIIDESIFEDEELEVVRIWNDPVRATRAAYNSLDESIKRLRSLPEIHVGDQFVESIEKLGIHHQPRLLRRIYSLSAMAAIKMIDQVNGADVHPVRQSIAANSPQIEIAGAKKWRCKISQHGAGFRLHYWSRPDGSIELDAVMVESKVN